LLACEVIVLLSDYEGLPIALMEAMACGCVPVCLRMRSGIPELVEDGETGLLVGDRGDGFVAAIRRLRDDRALWARLAEAARALIVERQSIESTAAQWVRLLEEMKGGKGSRAIELPSRMRLPQVHPALASADVRQVKVPLAVRVCRRGRMLAGCLKRRLLGQGIP
jgi:hypothetical protein